MSTREKLVKARLGMLALAEELQNITLACKRAVVFALLGWAIVVAGWSRDPSEVGTTASSLRTLAGQPGALGRWLLGVTAAGFVAYGFCEMIHARYLHIRRVR